MAKIARARRLKRTSTPKQRQLPIVVSGALSETNPRAAFPLSLIDAKTEVPESAGIVALTSIAEALRDSLQENDFQGQSDDLIDFDEAVSAAKPSVAEMETNYWRVVEFADRLKPKYGKETLKRFAKKLDIVYCTLKRHLSVYRSWKEIGAPAPRSYAVASELAAHPNRAAIVLAQPDLTKSDARKLMRGWRRQNQPGRRQQPRAANAPWTVKEAKRWVAGWVERGSLAIEDGPALDRMTPEILRQVIEPNTFDTMIKGALTWIKIVKQARRKLGPTQAKAAA